MNKKIIIKAKTEKGKQALKTAVFEGEKLLLEKSLKERMAFNIIWKQYYKEDIGFYELELTNRGMVLFRIEPRMIEQAYKTITNALLENGAEINIDYEAKDL